MNFKTVALSHSATAPSHLIIATCTRKTRSDKLPSTLQKTGRHCKEIGGDSRCFGIDRQVEWIGWLLRTAAKDSIRPHTLRPVYMPLGRSLQRADTVNLTVEEDPCGFTQRSS